jgi:uncharacterized protein
MHQASVEVFDHFLESLSDLLDHAAAHAEKRNIDPSILLNARLYPNMYNLTRQVGEQSAGEHSMPDALADLASIRRFFRKQHPSFPNSRHALRLRRISWQA